jgi:hypothetical protein
LRTSSTGGWIAFFIALVMVILPEKASACSICDEYLLKEYWHPVIQLCTLSVSWVLVLHIVGKRLYLELCKYEADLDPKKLPPNIPSLLIVGINYIVFFAVLELSHAFTYICQLFAFLITFICFTAYIMILPHRAPPVVGGLSLKMRPVNLTYGILATLLIVYTFVHAQSVDGIIEKAYRHDAYDDIRIVSRLIGKGEKVIEPLAGKIEKDRFHIFNKKHVPLSIFVIGKVGGDKAKASIAKLIKHEEVYIHDKYIESESGYQFVLLYAYADCCGHDAVPLLVALYKRTKPHDVKFRECIINALISIGGMQLVEESLPSHIDEIRVKFSSVPTDMDQTQRRQFLYKPVIRTNKDYKWHELSREIDERQGG